MNGHHSASEKGSSRRAFIKAGAALTGGVVLGVYVKPSIRSFAVDQAFAGGTPPPPIVPPPPPSVVVSPKTIGYWKNHTGSWPITTLRPFGCSGSSLSQADALRRLKQASAKDMRNMLAAQLIAAKLNVANGASRAIQPIIDASDDFLCRHPFGSALSGDDRGIARELKDQLDAYNNGGILTDDGWELDD